MSDRVLIIGGAGFIGLNLARYYSSNKFSVDILDNFSRGERDFEVDAILSNPGVRLLNIDLMASDNVETLSTDYSLIYHLAARVGVQNVVGNPYQTLFGNAELTDAAIHVGLRQTKLRRFIFASTSEIYAGTMEKGNLTIPTPESSPLILSDLEKGRTSYMLSKIVGESMCFYSGLPITIVRPHNIYGPRMGLSHVIPQILQRIHKSKDGDDLPVWSVNHTRTFCYIDDAVEMLSRFADSDECINTAINLGAQQPEITMGSLAKLILSILGREMNIVSESTHQGSPARRCPDMSLARGLVGFNARVGLEEGILRTWDWYRRNVF